METPKQAERETSLGFATAAVAGSRIGWAALCLLCWAGLGGCTNAVLAGERAEGRREPLIFGTDDRVEVTAVRDRNVQRAALAVGLLARSSSVSCSGGSCTLSTSPLSTGTVEGGTTRRLCSAAANRGQQAGGTCTAFLVGPDLLVTAGHCLTSTNCSARQVVFGFQADPDGSNEVTRVPDRNVYACTSVVARSDTGGGLTQNDWAVFRVDRKVVGRSPLPIRRGSVPAVGVELIAAGHPRGLPLKVSSNGFVETNGGSKKFETDLDMYGGNSGSPVLDLRTLVVQGIHTHRPATHYVSSRDASGRCAMDRVCSAATGCNPDASGVTRAWARAMRMAGTVDSDFPANNIPLRPVEVMATL